MSDSSDEEKIDGNTTPTWPCFRGKTHQGCNSKGTFTQRSVSPPATGHQPPVNQPPAIRPMDKKTLQTNKQPPVTSHRPNGHYTRNFKSVNHWSPAIQPPVIENFNTGESQYSPVTGHQSTGHWLPVSGHQTLYQSIISETHVMGMEFTNNPTSSKRVLLSWNRALVVCPTPVLSWNRPTTTGDRTTDKFLRLPSLDVFLERISLEIYINPRRGGDVDRLLLPPLRGLHLQTLAKEAESQKDPNILTGRGEKDTYIFFFFFFIIW